MRIVFLGSGAFGLPTLRALREHHEVALVISQPDRPAGRGRRATPTPITAYAAEHGLPSVRPADPNAAATVARLHDVAPEALVVIAYGHKLGRDLIGGRFAINLHASLLPAYRGAAPINWAIIRGERETGVTVITLADRMDAGLILGQRRLAIGALETAGELHDRLATLGPELVEEVLAAHRNGTLHGETQDPAAVTWAPRLSKGDGTVDFDQPATAVRQRVHGLTPWPGCRVELDGITLRLHRVREIDASPADLSPGALTPEGFVGCASGAVQLLELQPPGKRLMTFDEYARGRPIVERSVLTPLVAR